MGNKIAKNHVIRTGQENMSSGGGGGGGGGGG